MLHIQTLENIGSFDIINDIIKYVTVVKLMDIVGIVSFDVSISGS